jgi:ATP-dependent DNA helicase RecQ
LCDLLYTQYTIRGITPQKVCGGCPNCRKDARINGYFPTLNFTPSVLRPLSKREEPCFLFYSLEDSNIRELLRSWSNWIQSLIEKNRVVNICTTIEIAKRLSKTLPRGMNTFWSYDVLHTRKQVDISVPTLIIIPPGLDYLPAINSDDIPYLLLAPKSIPSPHFKRLWWQDYHSASSVDHYMSIEN